MRGHIIQLKTLERPIYKFVIFSIVMYLFYFAFITFHILQKLCCSIMMMTQMDKDRMDQMYSNQTSCFLSFLQQHSSPIHT